MEEETSYCSYGEAYEVNCARYGREADQPISHFKKRCCSPNGNLISDPDGALRLQVLKHQFHRVAPCYTPPASNVCRPWCHVGPIVNFARHKDTGLALQCCSLSSRARHDFLPEVPNSSDDVFKCRLIRR